MAKWIIDTNVAVHWLMVNQILEFLTKHFHLSQEFSNVYKNRYSKSCDFVNKVLELPKNDDEFLITELSVNELFSGLRDEIRTVILFVNGVPISRWAYKRETKEARLTDKLSKSIHELALKGFDTLFGSQKIRIVETTAPSDEPDYLEVYSSLVFLNPELRTQDAILITTAIFERADRFVTTDRDLINLGKELKARYNLEVLQPATALQTVK